MSLAVECLSGIPEEKERREEMILRTWEHTVVAKDAG